MRSQCPIQGSFHSPTPGITLSLTCLICLLVIVCMAVPTIGLSSFHRFVRTAFSIECEMSRCLHGSWGFLPVNLRSSQVHTHEGPGPPGRRWLVLSVPRIPVTFAGRTSPRRPRRTAAGPQWMNPSWASPILYVEFLSVPFNFDKASE